MSFKVQFEHEMAWVRCTDCHRWYAHETHGYDFAGCPHCQYKRIRDLLDDERRMLHRIAGLKGALKRTKARVEEER